MPKYEVMRSYTVCSVAIVEAENSDEAIEKAIVGDCITVKEYDSDYDEDITVEEISSERTDV